MVAGLAVRDVVEEAQVFHDIGAGEQQQAIGGLASRQKVPDLELLAWITGEAVVPARYDTPLFRRLRRFSRRGPLLGPAPRAGEGTGGGSG